ncbi:hypothetical protein JX265_004003 [Neoarthrinium moseri]|uniref:Uncharacterized protein n=1 Tax=Neoarthrinium moseri TaxID=1658444 RepID=A0A9P9WRF4_9PEZI|nr:uncharacterized protein JN550_006756 [Neoarthrinium moseri]KAI1867949.1 hypothetical protein JN550_006756 [Neoarthrinium moseri]KAI1876477.1 hypothetical protein JX265_004003 [Neoarthrinium moseri]
MKIPTSIPTDVLDPEHLDALNDAIHRVLNTDLALETYAQVIDGLPLCDVAWDRYQHRLYREHPISSHVNLCPGSLEMASSMRDDVDLSSLSFDNRLLQSYQASPPGSPAFEPRLLELVAVTLHQIAVYLFKKNVRLHDQNHAPGSSLSIENATSWKRVPTDGISLTIEPWPTLFTHPAFAANEQYPDGVADMVGYWAEDRILGGVVLFDRTKDWSDGAGSNEPNVFFQSSRPRRTYLIYQLTDDQQQSLLNFLVPRPLSGLREEASNHETPASGCPLPLLYSAENKVTVDPEFAVVSHKVYRDVWERSPPRPYQNLIRDRDIVDMPGAGDAELAKLRKFGL